MNRVKRFVIYISIFALSLPLAVLVSNDAQATSQYIFPVIGKSTFSNDFNSPRGSEKHNAIDIMANKHLPVVSATNGVVTYAPYPQPSWGWMIRIKSDSKYEYNYIHLNNDNKGTDDGKGGAMLAYAPDIKQGSRVIRGQLIGWVGDSGNAETTAPHLHFEVVKPDGKHYNPYTKLKNAQKISKPLVHPASSNEFLPFGKVGRELGNIHYGDVNNDGVRDLIVGSGEGTRPWVKVFSGTDNTKIADFYPFNSTSTTGADVTSGDVDGDGIEEIIVGARTGKQTKIGIYSIVDGKLTAKNNFVAYGSSVKLVRVASGDVDGDGKSDIVVGAGPGGGPRVNIYDESGTIKQTFYALSESFRGGVEVTVGNTHDNPNKEILTAAYSAGSSNVTVRSYDLVKLNEFNTYGKNYLGGVKISAANINQATPYDEIATMPDSYLAMFKYFNSNGERQRLSYPYEEWWVGKYDVAAYDGGYKTIASGNRRASVR